MNEAGVLQQAEDIRNDIVEYRRRFSAVPELALKEFQTAQIAADTLASFGFTIRRVGATGIVADIGKGPVIAIHAAMDALALAGPDKQPVTMHACGHDANMACLLGAARIAARRLRNHDKGSLRVLLQPGAELESGAGADALIEAGVLQNCLAIFSLHVDSTITAEKIALVKRSHSSEANNERNTKLFESVQTSLQSLLGEKRVANLTRTTYGEHFSRYIASEGSPPGLLLYLGAALAGSPRSHHAINFMIDEKALYVGAAALCEIAFSLHQAKPLLIG